MAHFGDQENVAGSAAANNVVSIKIRYFLYSLILLHKKDKIVKGLKSCLLLNYLISLRNQII